MKRLFSRMAIMALLAVISGCAIPAASPAGSSSDGPGTSGQPAAGLQTGNVELRITDAPRKDNVTAIYVTVTQVQIHKAGSDNDSDAEWITANLTSNNRFELLSLRKPNGVQIKDYLGSATLAAGKYTQVRLAVDNVSVTVDGVTKGADVPSGKIKLVHPFEVLPSGNTTLLFDFEADKMVTIAGKSGKILVKPVIKLTTEKTTGPANGPTQPPATQEPESLKITTPYLPNGNNNTAYNAALAAEGGSAPYSWTLKGGLLPPGLGLATTTGIVSGTPTQEGTFHFTVRVTDNSTPAKSNTKEFSIIIASQGTLMITNKSLPDAIKGTPYTAPLSAIGGTPPYGQWTIVSGALPTALNIDATTGIISGTPNPDNPATFNFTVQVTDNSTPNRTATQALSIKVSSP